MQASVSIPPASTATAPAGHDEAMAARVEAGAAAAAAGLSTIPAAAPAAPAADAATPPAAAPASAPAAAAPAAQEVPAEGAVTDILAKAGLTREALAAEYAAGGISEESFAKLAAQGISKADFNQYIAGRQAQADAYTNSVITATVGTPEKYAAVVEWAATALSPAEKTAFNNAVNSGDVAMAQLAVSGLASRHAAANPPEPTLLATGTPAAGVQGYDSWAQVTADMRDPQYAKDPAFRDRVRDKLAASPKDLKRA